MCEREWLGFQLVGLDLPRGRREATAGMLLSGRKMPYSTSEGR